MFLCWETIDRVHMTHRNRQKHRLGPRGRVCKSFFRDPEIWLSVFWPKTSKRDISAPRWTPGCVKLVPASNPSSPRINSKLQRPGSARKRVYTRGRQELQAKNFSRQVWNFLRGASQALKTRANDAPWPITVVTKFSGRSDADIVRIIGCSARGPLARPGRQGRGPGV